MVQATKVQALLEEYQARLTSESTSNLELDEILRALMLNPLFQPSSSGSTSQQEANCMRFVMSLRLGQDRIHGLIDNIMRHSEPVKSRVLSKPPQDPPLLFQYFVAYFIFLQQGGNLADGATSPNPAMQPTIDKALVIKSKFLPLDYESAYSLCQAEINKITLSRELPANLKRFFKEIARFAKNDNNHPLLAEALNATTQLFRRDISAVEYGALIKNIRTSYTLDNSSAPTVTESFCEMISEIMETMAEVFASIVSTVTRSSKPPTFFNPAESKEVSKAIESITTPTPNK